MLSTYTLNIGSRVVCDGDYGTVMYIGELDSMEGIWVGLEWDNPSRGKHSGDYKGIQYFSTRIPNTGSFVKLKKIETGKSCPEATREKYGGKDDLSCNQNYIDLPQTTGKKRVIELVGWQKIKGKQSQFEKLHEVVLSEMQINGPGAPGEVGNLIPNVVSLDLSSNLLVSWRDVITIVEQLPHLESLTLSKNRLKIPDDVHSFCNCFKSLKILALSSMTYNWEQILDCAEMWPSIEQLVLWANEITVLREPQFPVLSELRYLDLEGNHICSWQEICKLGKLSNLEKLNVDDIHLEAIEFSGVKPTEKTDLFSNLKIISIRNNYLSQWKDISELNKLKVLKEIRITNNPVLFSVIPETARQLIIAKVSGLEVLNRTEITRSERRGAELDYIKLYHHDWLQSGGCRNLSSSNPSLEFLIVHPTYESLLHKHGTAEDSEVIKENVLLKNNLTSVKFFSPLAPERPEIVKKIPGTMTVGKVKALVQRIYKVSAGDIHLSVVNEEDENAEIEMDNDLRELSFYSLSNGDKICVQW